MKIKETAKETAPSRALLQKLQGRLDERKWLASAAARRDLCGEMPWCAFCCREEEYPCARARIRERAAVAAEMTDVEAEIAQDERDAALAARSLAAEGESGAASTAEAIREAVQEAVLEQKLAGKDEE